MRYRIIIEGEATLPPPDYAETLRNIVSKETKFMLGKAWDVVSCEEIRSRTRVDSCVVPFRHLVTQGREAVLEHLATCPLPAEAHEGGAAFFSVIQQVGEIAGRVSGVDPDA